MRRLFLAASLIALLAASSVSAVSIDWVTVGDPGNTSDTTGFGSVGYSYQISKYEVTNAQYTEFLNAVGSLDNWELYSTTLNSGSSFSRGITRSGPRSRKLAGQLRHLLLGSALCELAP